MEIPFEELSNYCVKEFGAPNGFTISEAQLIGGDGKWPNFTHTKVNGAVYPLITRGKRVGEFNWKKPIEGTKREYYIPRGEAK